MATVPESTEVYASADFLRVRFEQAFRRRRKGKTGTRLKCYDGLDIDIEALIEKYPKQEEIFRTVREELHTLGLSFIEQHVDEEPLIFEEIPTVCEMLELPISDILNRHGVSQLLHLKEAVFRARRWLREDIERIMTTAQHELPPRPTVSLIPLLAEKGVPENAVKAFIHEQLTALFSARLQAALPSFAAQFHLDQSLSLETLHALLKIIPAMECCIDEIIEKNELVFPQFGRALRTYMTLQHTQVRLSDHMVTFIDQHVLACIRNFLCTPRTAKSFVTLLRNIPAAKPMHLDDILLIFQGDKITAGDSYPRQPYEVHHIKSKVSRRPQMLQKILAGERRQDLQAITKSLNDACHGGYSMRKSSFVKDLIADIQRAAQLEEQPSTESISTQIPPPSSIAEQPEQKEYHTFPQDALLEAQRQWHAMGCPQKLAKDQRRTLWRVASSCFPPEENISTESKHRFINAVTALPIAKQPENPEPTDIVATTNGHAPLPPDALSASEQQTALKILQHHRTTPAGGVEKIIALAINTVRHKKHQSQLQQQVFASFVREYLNSIVTEQPETDLPPTEHAQTDGASTHKPEPLVFVSEEITPTQEWPQHESNTVFHTLSIFEKGSEPREFSHIEDEWGRIALEKEELARQLSALTGKERLLTALQEKLRRQEENMAIERTALEEEREALKTKREELDAEREAFEEERDNFEVTVGDFGPGQEWSDDDQPSNQEDLEDIPEPSFLSFSDNVPMQTSQTVPVQETPSKIPSLTPYQKNDVLGQIASLQDAHKEAAQLRKELMASVNVLDRTREFATDLYEAVRDMQSEGPLSNEQIQQCIRKKFPDRNPVLCIAETSEYIATTKRMGMVMSLIQKLEQTWKDAEDRWEKEQQQAEDALNKNKKKGIAGGEGTGKRKTSAPLKASAGLCEQVRMCLVEVGEDCITDEEFTKRLRSIVDVD